MLKKILLFLATEKGYTVLYDLIKENFQEYIGCVITFQEIDVEKSYHTAIKSLCIENKIPFYMWNETKNHIIEVVKKYSITEAIAISWKYLIPLDINDFLQNRFIVFHDSLLPKYRGFAPTPTAIICGESTIGVTALFATDTVDQGEIILQKKMKVSKEEYIKEIIERQSSLYSEMVIELIKKIVKGKIVSYKQNEEEATYSIWRSPQDCHIDWKLSSLAIYNFIRAVGSPYPGAFSYYGAEKIIIDKSCVIEDLEFASRDYGKIWSIQDNCPEIICGQGMIRILKAHDSNKNPVIFNKVRCRLK